jgi:hypothetical protein
LTTIESTRHAARPASIRRRLGLAVALERRAWPVLPGAAAVWTLLTLVDVGAWLVGDIRWFG